MTVKVVLLKSGEDVIADVEEMVVAEKVVGYFFNYPLSVKLQGKESSEDKSRVPFKLRLTPWAPLAKEQHIPVVADWVVSIMDPIDDLLDMYTTSIQDYERKRKASGVGESESSDTD